jgi:hypothetical protein
MADIDPEGISESCEYEGAEEKAEASLLGHGLPQLSLSVPLK